MYEYYLVSLVKSGVSRVPHPLLYPVLAKESMSVSCQFLEHMWSNLYKQKNFHPVTRSSNNKPASLQILGTNFQKIKQKTKNRKKPH